MLHHPLRTGNSTLKAHGATTHDSRGGWPQLLPTTVNRSHDRTRRHYLTGALGDTDQARVHHSAALRLALEADAPLLQARAHSGLGSACQASGELLQARRHWEEALTLYVSIDAPEASEIRSRLATVPSPDDRLEDQCPPPLDRRVARGHLPPALTEPCLTVRLRGQQRPGPAPENPRQQKGRLRRPPRPSKTTVPRRMSEANVKLGLTET